MDKAANGESRKLGRIVFATGAGALFEGYDFILFGSLAPIISQHFFSGVNDTAAFIFSLLTFAAGFAIRPLGALFFGQLGDRRGRKRAFLITITIMGLSTFGIGLLPTYAMAGMFAPILLIAMRLSRGWPSAGNMAPPWSIWPSIRRPTGAVCSPAPSSPPPASRCSSPSR